MRNKLVKFHRKAGYYKLRRLAMAAAFFLLATVTVAVPLTFLGVAALDASTSEVSEVPGDIVLNPDVLNPSI
jgi:hypothetical protein